ncbi:MAG TPA: DinB family protein [Pirellulales bacterium]
MSIIPVMIETYKFHRDRTLATLTAIEKEPDPRAVLAWRPAPGRAHIGWQLMHIGITEEIFATERLIPKAPGPYHDLWPRFRGGSTPDDDVPTPDVIRKVLAETREQMLATVRELDESKLDVVPEPLKERGWTFRAALSIIGWHEPHHQGQAHITYNLFKAQAKH